MLPIFILLAAVAASQRSTDDQHSMGPHDIAWDSSGRLVFTQLQAKTHSRSKSAESPLYSVNVGFDIEAMQIEKGLTMTFDKKNHVLRLDSGVKTDGVAWGHYVDRINQTGWSELYVDTTNNNEVSNDVRMYSAGYIEGLLTVVRLSEFHYNTYHMLMRTEATKHAVDSLKTLFKSQIAVMREKANLIPHIMGEEPTNSYDKHTRFILFQLWGICDGYNYAVKVFGTNKLALEDLLALNAGGELAELVMAYTPQAKADRASAQLMGLSFLQRNQNRARTYLHNLKVRRSRNRAEMSRLQESSKADGDSVKEDLLDDAHWEKRLAETGHCSAMIKVADHNKDIFMGHTTWDDYSKMTRIFKYYNFHLDGAETMATRIGFSSYPGLISSTDNFYVMDSGLAVMDTSVEILDPTVWDKVEDFPAYPHIPNFVHQMITNRLAKNGAHWTRLLATQNTGTYTSQWMIVDYNRFKANKLVPDDTFWMIETIPGKTHAADMSFHLRDSGYWPSFNRPYFDDIRLLSGFEVAQKTKGALYSWLNNPRAQIFKSAQRVTDSLMEMRGMMTRNFYPASGVMPIEPSHEISARFDLSTSMRIPNGGIDAKVINRCLFSRLQVQTISGPSHANLPAFNWLRKDGSEEFGGYPHNGMPDLWNFDWVQQTPEETSAIFDWNDC